MVLIGAGPWLHVPVGKLREDHYLPLDSQLVWSMSTGPRMSHPVIRCCRRAARLLSAGAPNAWGLPRCGEQLRGFGVRFTQEPATMGPVTTTVLDDTRRNLIQIAHWGGSRAPPVQTSPGDEAGPSATSTKRGS